MLSKYKPNEHKPASSLLISPIFDQSCVIDWDQSQMEHGSIMNIHVDAILTAHHRNYQPLECAGSNYVHLYLGKELDHEIDACVDNMKQRPI